eukprot:TRINITY_DN322_c0_g1_i1.p1 TRINITY_DN322_c0_g1~~TRINITY_DN322_c0_g1_i1.p1  ORF type:complete len:246 (+),score=21.15 TRINITY_DN322_c0_g1_i1:65-802(+)
MSPFCTRVVFVSFCFLLLYLIFVGTPTFSSVQIFGRSSEEPRKQTLPLCRFVTGTRHVTDDRGFVCRWQDLNYTTGCCPRTEERYGCNSCNTTAECCSSYSFCVACCLNPDLTIESAIGGLSLPILKSLRSSKFELCQTLCRTSSKTVTEEHNYRSSLKYCYGDKPPPIVDKFSHEIYNTAKDETSELKSEATVVTEENVISSSPVTSNATRLLGKRYYVLTIMVLFMCYIFCYYLSAPQKQKKE